MKRNLLGKVLIVIVIVFIIVLFLTKSDKKKKGVDVGALFPLTGDYAPWGKRAQRAAELALEEINNSYLKGLKIKIIYEDSPGEPMKAISAFNKLVEIDNVKFILGPLSSVETLAIAPIAERKKIIVMTPVSSAPDITKAGDYIFRNCVSDVFEGTIAAKFVLRELNIKKAAILYVNNDYGIGIKKNFEGEFNSLGGIILKEESFNIEDNDFRTQLSKINSSNPGITILAGYAAEMAQILKQTHELGINIQYLSFSPFESPEILDIARKAAEGVYYVYQGFNVNDEEMMVKKFVDKYRSEYQENPDIFAALTYEALKIYATAFNEAHEINPKSVKDALYNIKNFKGITGTTSFDQNGDVIKPIGIKIVKNGEFEWIDRRFEIGDNK